MQNSEINILPRVSPLTVKCVFANFPTLHISDTSTPLTIRVTTKTLPDTKEFQSRAENSLYTSLKSKGAVSYLSQNMSRELDAKVELNNVRLGSIKMDLFLCDMSNLEEIKELSDTGVLSNIVDSILMTPKFIESCGAEDVSLDVMIEEESYQQVKSQNGRPIYKSSLTRDDW